MFELIDSNQTPPCGWTYEIPETGLYVEAESMQDLLEQVKANLELNHVQYKKSLLYPKIVESLCKRSPTGICKNFVNRFITRSRDVQNGTIALWAIIRKGRGAFVSKEIAEERAKICSQCHYNIDNPGCSTCKGFRTVINTSKHRRSTTLDAQLKTCGICRCFVEVLVHVNKDVVKRTTGKHQIQEYPDYCWKKQLLMEK